MGVEVPKRGYNCCLFHDTNGAEGGLKDCPRYEGFDDVDRLPDGLIIRLHVCDSGHLPVSFMSEAKEGCPCCSFRRMLELQEGEVNNLQEKLQTMTRCVNRDECHAIGDCGICVRCGHNIEPFPRKRRVARRTSSPNPRYRRRTSTGAAVLLGAVAGFIAGMSSKSKGTN
jgi:hypothetical protein